MAGPRWFFLVGRDPGAPCCHAPPSHGNCHHQIALRLTSSFLSTTTYALPAARPTRLRSDSTLHPGTISARPDRRPDSPPLHESWQKSTLDTTPPVGPPAAPTPPV